MISSDKAGVQFPDSEMFFCFFLERNDFFLIEVVAGDGFDRLGIKLSEGRVTHRTGPTAC